MGIALLLALIVVIMAKNGFAQEDAGVTGEARDPYARGTNLIQQEKYEEARTMLENVLRADPSDPDLHEMLGDVCTRLKDPDRALEAYTQAIKRGSRRSSTYFNRGTLRAMLRDWDKAIADFNESVRLEPGRPDCYYNRAQAYRNLRQYAKARADLERAYELGKKSTTASTLALLLAASPDAVVRDGRRAVEYAMEACRQTEFKEYHSLSVLASAHAEAGQWDEAVFRAKQALDLADLVWRRYERVYLELYRLHEPYRDFPPELIAERSSSTAGEALLYALVKDSIGDCKGALVELRKAIRWNPRLATAHYELGCLILARDLNEAVSHFDRCLELDPKHSDAFYARACANVWMGKYREALTDAKASFTLNQKDYLARTMYAWSLASLGEVDRAWQELKELSRIQKDDAWLHSLRGHCYLIKGQFKDAISEFTSALQYSSTDLLAFADRAVALSALGKPDEAKRDLEKCVHFAPSLRTLVETRMKEATQKAPSPR
jgi:tetratricopeptide (TPR) repeat protein